MRGKVNSTTTKSKRTRTIRQSFTIVLPRVDWPCGDHTHEGIVTRCPFCKHVNKVCYCCAADSDFCDHLAEVDSTDSETLRVVFATPEYRSRRYGYDQAEWI